MIYRRANRHPAWHFCQNCPGWPKQDYREQTIEPPREFLCPDCAERQEAMRCEVLPEPGIS